MTLEPLQTELKALDGRLGRMWNFEASSNRLLVCFGGDRQFEMEFKFCERIEASTFWFVKRPSIKAGEGGRLIYRDKLAKIVRLEMVLKELTVGQEAVTSSPPTQV